MFGNFEAWQGMFHGAAVEGYYDPPNFTIMQALHYLSFLVESTNDLHETPLNSVLSQVNFPYARHSTIAAPSIQQPRPYTSGSHDGYGYGYIGQSNYQGGILGVQVLGDYNRTEYSQYQDVLTTYACNSNYGM